MGSRWDSGPDALSPWETSAFPPRWSEAARDLLDEASTVGGPKPSRSPGHTRDFRLGARADGLPAAVTRGLRWLDAEVRGDAPSEAALLLGQHFQERYAALLDVDRVFLPEEPVAYTLGATLATLLPLPPRQVATVVVASSVAQSRQQVVRAWCERLGLLCSVIDDPSAVPTPTAAVLVETPNALGLLENLAAWRAAAGPDVPLLVCSLDPLAFFAADLPVGTFADILVFDVAALASSGDEAAAVAASAPWAQKIAGLFVETSTENGEARHLRRSDGVPADDEPSWTPVFAAALLAAELGATGFRRRARAVMQRRRWLEAFLDRRGVPVALPAGNRFRESRFEVPRWLGRRDIALSEKFRLDEPLTPTGAVGVRCPLAARRRDVVRLGEVLAGG